MTEENKVALTSKRAELIELLAKPLPPEDRRRLQDELSILKAKIKAINTSNDIKLKAEADRRKAAGMAEARANAARARANLGLPVEKIEEEDDPAQAQAIDAWIVGVLQDHDVTSSIADGFSFEAPPKWAAIITALRAGLHAAARGQELPTWNGLCPAGKHGLDRQGQPCDLCAAETKAAAPKKAKKRP